MLQAFDVVVVNDASVLRCRTFQPFAEAFAHFSGEVLPAVVAVLARDDTLRVALRQRQVDFRQVRALPCRGLVAPCPRDPGRMHFEFTRINITTTILRKRPRILARN